VNLDHADHDCDLDYVPHASRELPVDVAMSNSFGFGGQNTILVLRRF
jgi:3-oxoacyl-[acyl-carrier-protein] synthase II